MKIVKQYNVWNHHIHKVYGIIFNITDNNGRWYPVFIKTDNLVDENTVWIDINNLDNEQFFKDKNIEYLVEVINNERNIIPIGLIDFYEKGIYCYSELNIYNCDGKNLHNANKIIKNIERAIKIKYETMKFINKFGLANNQTEEIELE